MCDLIFPPLSECTSPNQPEQDGKRLQVFHSCGTAGRSGYFAAMHEQLTECYVVKSDYITIVYPDIPRILAYLNIRLVAVCDAFARLAPFVLWQFLFLF